MTVLAIIQARMGSSRLAGKTLADIAGRPMLARVVDRVKQIPHVDRIVVATTANAADETVVRLATACGVGCFAGSEHDVLDRFHGAALHYRADAIVRITADCPLLDPQVAGRVVSRFLADPCDYASNVHPPTYPDGLDTEVMSFAVLQDAWERAQSAFDREHVTPYIWSHPERFRIVNVEHSIDLTPLRWTVDEAADLTFVNAVYTGLAASGGTFGMQEVLGLLKRCPDLLSINVQHNRKAAQIPTIQRNAGHVDRAN